MLACLFGQGPGLDRDRDSDSDELKSDVLMLPHHGAEDTFQEVWDEKVNPKAIVIGAAPHGGLLEKPDKGYRHPRGETILKSLQLLQGRGRIWNKVMPHAIEYYCNEASHLQIQEMFISHENYLFERVPNTTLNELIPQPHSRWHLVWTDAPIYTLWTTGSLVFKGNATTPQFIDAPNGLMGYVALPSPEYYLSPAHRPQNIALTQLIGYFLQDGEGNPEVLSNTITSFPVESIRNTEREGILLTQGLTLIENRAKILKALWEIPIEQRGEILTQFKALTKCVTKDHSIMYHIFEYLLRMENRENYLNYLNEKAILFPNDASKTTKGLKVFSLLPLGEVQQIIELFQLTIYTSFQNLSLREYKNLLEMIEVLENSTTNRRANIFNAVSPVLMPYESHEDHNKKFHDESDNANLIRLYSNESEGSLPLFKERFETVINCLNMDGDSSLYPENKHYFIKKFITFPAQDRLAFLGDLFPAIQPLAGAGCISYEIPMICEELANIYNQPNPIIYRLRLDYFAQRLAMELTKLPFREGECIGMFKTWMPFSLSYAQKRAMSTQWSQQ